MRSIISEACSILFIVIWILSSVSFFIILYPLCVSVSLIPLKILVKRIQSFKTILFVLGILTVFQRNLDPRTIYKSGFSWKAFWNCGKSSNPCCPSASKCTTYWIFSQNLLIYSDPVSKAPPCPRFITCLIVTIAFQE